MAIISVKQNELDPGGSLYLHSEVLPIKTAIQPLYLSKLKPELGREFQPITAAELQPTPGNQVSNPCSNKANTKPELIQFSLNVFADSIISRSLPESPLVLSTAQFSHLSVFN